MKFSDFVCFDATVPQLQAETRDGVIEELVLSLDRCGKLGKENSKTVIKAVIKRENEASTGMGKAVAVPHIKSKAVHDVVAVVGQSLKGIDFAALDRNVVHSVILMISPVDEPDKHLQAMECIFRHLQQEKFRRFFRQCQKAEQIKDLFLEADEDASL
jgi:nitrogen PTS system EIIA component